MWQVMGVRVAATPAGDGPSTARLNAGWWVRALTGGERSGDGHAARPTWAEGAEQAVARAAPAPPDLAGSLSASLWPFLLGVRERLADGARRCLPPQHADPGLLAGSYTAALREHLFRIASRTLQSELDIAGGEPQHLAGLVARLCTPDGLAALLREYPVLARLLAVASQHAADAGLELLTRFAADRAAVIGELLGGTDPGPVVAVEPGLGDRHRDGRTVAAIEFADGRRLIYKPRDQDAQALFGQVIDWLNQRVPTAGLRTPAMVRRPGYAWVEFIASEPLPAPEAAAEFFWREGLLLAVLYAMQASDMHCENLIAAGAVPVLVDVETLFQPALPLPVVTAADPAARAVGDSVLRTALLPCVIVDENGALDWSGISGGQPGDRRAVNRPRLRGEVLEPARYETTLIAGFRLGYDTIAGHRPEFARLIEQCGDLEVRIVIRPTSGYARLLDESTHPDFLRDASDRQDALNVLLTVSAGHPLWAQAAQHELADLWNGDIPLLTSRPSAPDIWTSSGKRLPGLLEQPGLDCVRDKLTSMGEADRRDQEWIISASMATRRPHGGHHSTDLMPGLVTATAAEPSRLLAAACGLADQIASRAINGDETGRVNWIGLQLVEDTQWMVLPMGAGLADGYLGVALFLAQLAELTGLDRYADLARRAITALPELLAGLDGRPELISAVGCGGLDGLGGISYGLARMSRLLHDPALTDWAVKAAGLAAVADGDGAAVGWAAGSAGFLAAMIAVQAETGSPAAGELARACADRLSALAERTSGRCAPDDGSAPAGFAAGAAGVAWALTRFAAATGEPRYSAAAQRAAGHARAQGNMPAAASPPGWCSGWAGALLALPCLPAQADVIESAIGTLAERPVLSDLSLCHGELGIAEVLTMLAAAAPGQAAARARRHRASLILDVVNRHASYCGTPGGLLTPGLLTGLAGIGYGLLRFGFADRVPSVLLLEPGCAQ
jgi:lantibiotic modifying enzyme